MTVQTPTRHERLLVPQTPVPLGNSKVLNIRIFYPEAKTQLFEKLPVLSRIPEKFRSMNFVRND